MLRQARFVDFQTKVNLLRLRPTPALLAILLTLFSLALIAIFTTVIWAIDDPLAGVDYDRINELGTTAQATITDIETQENVSINHKHPVIVSYKYYIDSVNAHTIEAHGSLQTLSLREVSQLAPGDEIEIKYLDGESSIPSLEPFSFPFWIFYGFFYVFFFGMLIAGIIFTVITIRYLRKHIALYRYGVVREAKLISVTQSSTNHNKALRIDYQYSTSQGQPIMDASRSTDYTLLRLSNYGDPIKIFVLPTNEQHSCIIPHLEAIRNNWQL